MTHDTPTSSGFGYVLAAERRLARGAQKPRLVADALIVAAASHAARGQTRKYTGEPYIVHPIAVADIVKGVAHDDAMIAAALLHDVREDTAVGRDLLSEIFGDDVTDLVACLTEDDFRHASRSFRLVRQRAKLAKAPAQAQTIKVADIIDNTATIRHRDPAFALVYLAEKRQLLEVLTRADKILLARAHAQVSS